MEHDLRPLHSEVGVALVCDGPIFLQQDLYSALSGREIVDLPPIAEGERRDVLRNPASPPFGWMTVSGGGGGWVQYLPPVFTGIPLDPPQTIISLPVQTAV